MKIFFGIDLTQNKKNEQVYGEEFLVQEPSSALTQALEKSSDLAVTTILNSKLPLPIRIIQWICGFLSFFIVTVLVGIIFNKDNIPLSQAYQNVPWFFWLGGASLLIWIVLTISSTRKQKEVLESDEGKVTFEHLDNTCEAIFSELNVPSDAKEVDILSFFYKTKNESIKVCEKGMQIAPYMNHSLRAFKDSENLYLANLEGKYAFPLAAIKSIKTIKKSICIDEWIKDEPYNKGIYKQYKLSETNLGSIVCNPYHIIELEHNGETWAIYTTCYELPVFEELTGLKAQEK